MKNKKEIEERKAMFVKAWADTPALQDEMRRDLNRLLNVIIPSRPEAAEIAAERTGVVKAPDAAYYSFQRAIKYVRDLVIS